MTKTAVKRTFDRIAEKYDSIKVQIIPKYREAEKLVDSYISFPENRRLNILELGTGTGLWASRILRRYPNARYRGIEFSEEMIKAATHRLRRYLNRAKLERSDLNRTPLTGPYNLVVSFFTIHHVVEKGRLIQNIQRNLTDGGIFLFVDVTVAADPHLEKIYVDHWKHFMKSTPFPNSRIRNVIQDHLKNDLPETIESHLKILEESGFNHYGLIWCHEKFAAFYGQK